jgi:hypothetical protein
MLGSNGSFTRDLYPRINVSVHSFVHFVSECYSLFKISILVDDFNSQSEMSLEAIQVLTKSAEENSKRAKKNKPVSMIDPSSGQIIRLYGSQTVALIDLNLKRSNQIYLCCNGQADTYVGYKWEYYKGDITVDKCKLFAVYCYVVFLSSC